MNNDNGGVHHHSILASRLTHLHIPTISSSTSPNQEFDFSFSPSSPEIIHQRSHSLVGPSPRLSPDRFTATQFDYSSSDDTSTSNGGIDVFGAIYDDLDDVKEEEEEEIGGVDKEVKKMSPADFEILRVIGKGAFGKVFQVRMKKGNTIITDNDNGNGNGNGDGDGDGIFAMKVMRKETIIKNNHVDYMRAERDILTKVEHPFIVQLRYSFQTKSKLYLILDFINGGHLFYHLYRQRIFSEDQARVYTAEIVSAVSHLHKSGIVHRDLKPENILMDSDGHVMLTDFGLAKEIDESSRSNSMCGTTEYMAPEILLSKGHNKDADWWSIGILLFEMISGQPPFTHVNRKKLQEKIINKKLKLPPHLSTEAHSLLKGLIEKDPSKRLGSGPKGADEIKFHKWFKTVNWKRLEAREIQPKFKPDVIGKDCTANFDKCWTAMPLDDSPAPTPTTTGEHFEGYSYVAPNPWLSSQ